ncbi:MAG: pitrilysin family protein [Bacillota bacterium]|nr:pitrilysin family protein [Bacillota bacterium]
MRSDIKIIEIDKGVKLHLIKSEKFKTDLIGVYIKRPLKESEASKNAVLTRILERGTASYPTAKEFNENLDALFGAILISDVHKYGEKHVFQFKMQIPDKKYVGAEKIFEESIELLNELINKPFLVDGMFNEIYLEQEKKILIQTIKAIKDDKMNYALHQCVENMCENENYRISENGSVEEVQKIDSVSLYKHYKEVLKSSPIDICIIGDIDFDYTEKIVREKLVFERDEIISIDREKTYKNIKEVKYIEESMDVSQAKLTLGYRTNIRYEDENYEASVLFASVLGGGANSKLFNEIREEKSLSYYIYAKLDKFKSIMLIAAGINTKDKEEVIKLIKNNIEKIQNGGITKEELDIAKKSIISSLESRGDYPNSFINYYYDQRLTRKKIDIKYVIEKYKNITTDQVVEASKKIELDIIHFIKEKEKVHTNGN